MIKNLEAQSLPLGEERASEVIEFALKESGADATEVVIRGENTNLTRFTNLAMHQNVTENTCQILFRTIWDGRVVIVESNDLSKEATRRALLRSEKLAAEASPRAILPDFDYAAESSRECDVITLSESTASCGPQDRARGVDRVCRVFRRCGVNGAGNIRVRLLELAVGNSSGLRRYAPFSIVALVVVAMDEANKSSGYQNWIGRDIERMDPEGLAQEVTIKCLMGRNPRIIEPRPMVAILEPPAVAQLLFHLNFRSLGVFGAKSARNSDSIIFENLGEMITSSKISIYDDMRADGFVPMPFDYEGVEKKRLDLVKDGVASGIAHDLTSASEFDELPTGHAQLPGINPETGGEFGPSPQHLVMEAGSNPVSELIASTEYGVLVSRIHGFVSPLSGKQGYMAGTTRDGVFLIENGEISGPIRNLRWMDRIFSAFETVEGISRERKVQFTDELWFPTSALVPTIKLQEFNFVDTQRWSEEQPVPAGK
jgi:predicted Zn-dependent protease